MLALIKKDRILQDAIKCICTDPLTVGGDSKQISLVKSKTEHEFPSGVSSLKTFEGGILFGLANGCLGFLNQKKEEPAGTLNNTDGLPTAECKHNEFIRIHSSKVTTIDTNNKETAIITGGWDNAVVLLKKTMEPTEIRINGQFYRKTVYPHPNAVWSARFIGENTFITGCADTVMRVYNEGGLLKEITHHNHVIRGILLKDNFIYSVDNYGSVIKHTKDGRILKSRFLDEICFSICSFNKQVVICGSNGSCFILDEDLKAVEMVKLPSTDCWIVDSKDDVLFIGGSDGVLYYLKEGGNEVKPNSGEDVSDGMRSSVSHNGLDNKDDLNDKDDKNDLNDNISGKNDLNDNENTIKQKDGEFISNGIKYKLDQGKIYVLNGDNWELIGDTVKTYDHSFTVELGNEKYTLSFDKSENPHEVASRFISENKLDKSHHSEIVDYINSNFKGSSAYKKYQTIDIAGITKAIGDHPIIGILNRVSSGEKFSLFNNDSQNIYEIEESLFNTGIPLFIILDICKYLVFKGIFLDMSFILRNSFQDRNEARAFAYLLTNLVDNPPFNGVLLDKKLKSLKDLGLLNENDVSKYEDNFRIKSRQNRN